MQRCKWCNINNPLYIKYHDEEWGVLNLNDDYLFEMLILESFQAGLSWECLLNKRENFKKAYSNFDINKVCDFNEKMVKKLLMNEGIIRNKLKIEASINNAKIFRDIQNEFGSFKDYLDSFTNGKTFIILNKITSPLSLSISKDLMKRGMKFVGNTIIYSFLQAVGIIYSHEEGCYLFKNE